MRIKTGAVLVYARYVRPNVPNSIPFPADLIPLTPEAMRRKGWKWANVSEQGLTQLTAQLGWNPLDEGLMDAEASKYPSYREGVLLG